MTDLLTVTPLDIIFVTINLCDILRDSLRVFLVSLKGVLQKFEHHNRIFLLYALIQKFKKISHTYRTLNSVILNRKKRIQESFGNLWNPFLLTQCP